LQLASTPATQYKLPAGSLAPPNPRPPKPTPLTGKSAPRRKHIGYSAELDSFTYLVAPQAQAQVLRTTNKLTTSLRIDPAGSDKTADTRAVAELQAALAKASSGGMGELGLGTVQITEDPELAKKKAEAAEKEKMRAAKRREAQEVRNRERFDRGGRRPGLGGVGGGLNAAMLEDEDDELGAGISRSRPTKPRSGAKPKKRSAASRRGEILTDDDEEFDSRRRTKEDSYDEEDGFLVNDEEEEVVDGDEEEDEEEEEEEEIDERPAKVAKPSPKRVREDVDADADADGDVDAEGEPDDDAGDVAGARTKRRRIVDDEDEE
jgi:RNA polymerase-associated protein LEO1